MAGGAIGFVLARGAAAFGYRGSPAKRGFSLLPSDDVASQGSVITTEHASNVPLGSCSTAVMVPTSPIVIAAKLTTAPLRV